jgi:hypothetical protein
MQFLRLRRFTLETLPTRMAKAYASHLSLRTFMQRNARKGAEDLALFGSICALDRET